MSGFPQYENVLQGDSSDPFLGEDTYLVAENKNSLKQGILALANTTRDAEVTGALQRAGVEDLTNSKSFFLASGEKATVYLKGGIWRVTRYSEDGSQETVKTTAETREAAQLQAAKYFAKKTVTIRPLTPEEELYIIRLCHLGRIEDALHNYLFYRCGEVDHDPVDDPRYVEVSNDCVWLLFEHSTPSFDENARAWMEQRLANRKVLNLQLLRVAFREYEIERAKADRVSLLPRTQPAPEPEINIEDLSDAEIAELKEKTLLEFSRQRQRR